MKDINAILLAGGSGERLGGKAKWELQAGEETYLARLIRLLAGISSKLIVAVPEGDRATIENSYSHLGCEFVTGGSTRQQSIENALDFVTSEKVLIHEVARPLITEWQLKELVEISSSYEAVTCGHKIPVRDSVVLSDGHIVKETIPRSEVFTIQTPQVFLKNHMVKAFEDAKRRAVEYDSLVPMIKDIGVDIHLFEGSTHNIKVTYPEDVLTVEKLVAMEKNH